MYICAFFHKIGFFFHPKEPIFTFLEMTSPCREHMASFDNFPHVVSHTVSTYIGICMAYTRLFNLQNKIYSHFIDNKIKVHKA